MISTPDSMPLNFSHTYSFQDMRGQLPYLTYRSGSIMHTLATNDDFRLFTYIVRKAQFEGKLDDAVANFTLFAPTDASLREQGINESSLTRMDATFAIKLVQMSLLERLITQQIIQDTPFFQIPSYNRHQFLFFSTVSERTMINSSVEIAEFNIRCCNGMIHKVNGLLQPVQYS